MPTISLHRNKTNASRAYFDVLQDTHIVFDPKQHDPETKVERVSASVRSLRSPRTLLINTDTGEALGQVIAHRSKLKDFKTRKIIATIHQGEHKEIIVHWRDLALFNTNQHANVAFKKTDGYEVRRQIDLSKQYIVLKGAITEVNPEAYQHNEIDVLNYQQWQRRRYTFNTKAASISNSDSSTSSPEIESQPTISTEYGILPPGIQFFREPTFTALSNNEHLTTVRTNNEDPEVQWDEWVHLPPSP